MSRVSFSSPIVGGQIIRTDVRIFYSYYSGIHHPEHTLNRRVGTFKYYKRTLEEKTVNRVQEYQGRWYLIENVPALVCQQCGETYFKPATHDLILRLVQSDNPPTRIEQLDVIDASKAS